MIAPAYLLPNTGECCRRLPGLLGLAQGCVLVALLFTAKGRCRVRAAAGRGNRDPPD
jgi:hypothetical protein